MKNWEIKEWNYEDELAQEAVDDAPIPEKPVKEKVITPESGERITINIVLEPEEKNHLDILGMTMGRMVNRLRQFFLSEVINAEEKIEFDNDIIQFLNSHYMIKRMIANLKTFQMMSSGNDLFKYWDADEETLYTVPIKSVIWKFPDFPSDEEKEIPKDDMKAYVNTIKESLKLSPEKVEDGVPKLVIGKPRNRYSEMLKMEEEQIRASGLIL